MTRAQLAGRDASHDVVHLTREDLAATLAAYRTARDSMRIRGPRILFIGSIFATVVSLGVAKAFAWPDLVWSVMFAGGGSLALGSMFVGIRRERALIEAHQWICTSCRTQLIRATDAGLLRPEAALGTGRCPGCGDPLFDLKDTATLAG